MRIKGKRPRFYTLFKSTHIVQYQHNMMTKKTQMLLNPGIPWKFINGLAVLAGSSNFVEKKDEHQ